MRFRVPQFLDIKNKIFGPLTLKQFLYLAGGGGLCAVVWFTVPYTILAIILIVPIAALALALAFYKMNDKPFIEILEAGFYYILNSRMFVWQHRKRQAPKDTAEAPAEKQEQPQAPPQVTQGKLKELMWDVDVSAGGGSDDEE